MQELDERTKELIAIGCSVAAKCQPCLKYHLKKAQEVGVKDWQIKQAIALGKMISNKANEFMAQFSDEVLVSLSASQPCCDSGDSTACKV